MARTTEHRHADSGRIGSQQPYDLSEGPLLAGEQDAEPEHLGRRPHRCHGEQHHTGHRRRHLQGSGLAHDHPHVHDHGGGHRDQRQDDGKRTLKAVQQRQRHPQLPQLHDGHGPQQL